MTTLARADMMGRLVLAILSCEGSGRAWKTTFTRRFGPLMTGSRVASPCTTTMALPRVGGRICLYGMNYVVSSVFLTVVARVFSKPASLGAGQD
jgi:hypothetical protein